MPGASPTINSCALASPNEATGALCQSGSFARACARNSASLGQSGQLRPGSKEAGAGRLAMCPKRFRAKAGHGPGSGIDAGARQESAQKQKTPVLVQSEPKRYQL